MRARFAAAVAVLALLLAGCDGGQVEERDETPEARQSPTATASPTATVTPTESPAAQAGTFQVTLSGGNEVPPADSGMDGTGTVTLDADQGTACPSLTISTPADAEITGAHIHRGAAGTNGPIVVRFQVEAKSVKPDCASAEEEVINEITQNPSGFYVNVHTKSFPEGAARGQLNAAP